MSIPHPSAAELRGVALAAPTSLARTLRFDGNDPRHFDAPAPRSTALQVGGFKGEVALGASCNCRAITLVPHCHGTHTETAAHLTLEPLDACETAPRGLVPGWLVSVAAVAAETSGEDSDPPPQPGDRLLTRAALLAAWRGIPCFTPRALIVRAAGDSATFFSRQAVALLVERGIEHLVVELPSIDRGHDGGVLCGHRLFFGLPAGSTRLAEARRAQCTITEFAEVPPELADGPCFVQLAMPRIAGDAVPSQPLYFPLAPGAGDST